MMQIAGKRFFVLVAAVAAVVVFGPSAAGAAVTELASISVPGSVVPGGTISFDGSFCQIRDVNAVLGATATIEVPGGTNIVTTLTRGAFVPGVGGVGQVPLTGSATAPLTVDAYTVTLECTLDTGGPVTRSTTVDVEGGAVSTTSSTTTAAPTTTASPATTAAPTTVAPATTSTTEPAASVKGESELANGSELANTGQASRPLLALGLSLLIGGLLVSAAARRRSN